MALKNSKYAPKTPLEAAVLSKAEKLKQEKAKATRLLNRLQWKAETLLGSYLRAIEILHADVNRTGHHFGHAGLRNVFLRATNSKQAEAMFKVDFFEFYTLLERYITLCLSIFGINISADAPRTNVNALRYITNPSLQWRRPDGLHAFHANLLEALDQESCPLHLALGRQDVRIQLGFAKDYRNAWKDADENHATMNHGLRDEPRRNVRLQDLELEKMLTLLLEGCEQSLVIVQAHNPANVNDSTSTPFEPQAHSYDSMEIEAPYEFTGDAMDLD